MTRPPPGLDIEIVEIGGETVLLLSWPTANGTAETAKLTDAEADVLRAIQRGASNADIARERGTSVRTVANQIQALFRKLGGHSRHHLVAKTEARQT